MYWVKFPDLSNYQIRNAKILTEFLSPKIWQRNKTDDRYDVKIADGRIEKILPASEKPCLPSDVDIDGKMLWPHFTDIHAHLDKAFTWDRSQNPEGTFEGAASAMNRDRDRYWDDDDVNRRMNFTLCCARNHGTTAIRTHVDSRKRVADISWRQFARLKKSWHDEINLQGVATLPLPDLQGPHGEHIAKLVAENEGLLGAIITGNTEIDGDIDRLFSLAKSFDLDLDIHVDENGNPDSNGLESVADFVLKAGYERRVTCGHCCALSNMSLSRSSEIVSKVADAGIHIVSLPLCNTYLQGRGSGQTPVWRGITRLHELMRAKVPISLGSDNVRDAFHPYGDMDMLEVFSFGVKIGHLDNPISNWVSTVTSTPTKILSGLDGFAFHERDPANFILFNARELHQLLSRPQTDRMIVKSGVRKEYELPDYEKLGSPIAG